MATLTGKTEVFTGDTSVIDTTQKHKFLTRAYDTDGNEYIYLPGCTSGAQYKWVTYDEDGATTLLAADAVGPVAVMMATLDATTDYGWCCIFGETTAYLAANCADNAKLGFETTAGYAGDGCAAGDAITGAVSRGSTTTAAATTVQLCYPSVNDSSA